MVTKVMKNVMARVEAMLAGHRECRGLFRVVDHRGQPLSGVEVSYKVGDSAWIPCGTSRVEFTKEANYYQLSTIFYPMGEPVVWKFAKEGFATQKVTRYTADTSFDARLWTVVLSAAQELLPSDQEEKLATA